MATVNKNKEKDLANNNTRSAKKDVTANPETVKDTAKSVGRKISNKIDDAIAGMDREKVLFHPKSGIAKDIRLYDLFELYKQRFHEIAETCKERNV